jgi:hypothetical protein
MGHTFHLPDDIYSEIATYAAQHGQTPDALLITLVKEGVEQLKHTDKMAAIRKVNLNYDPDWIERHDEYFANQVG